MTDLSKYTIGWICAIDTEYTAAQAFLDETHEPPGAIPVHDHNAYTLGRAGKHNVVIAVLPDGEYGLSTAGVVAQRMLDSFPNVRLGLMVGIGGGAPSQRPGHDIRLGDVVVSSPRDGHSGVLQYDFGKTIQNQEFKITRTLNLPPNILRTAVSNLRSTFEMTGSDIPEAIETALSKKPRLRRKYGRPPQETDVLFLSHVVYDPRRPIEAPEPDLLVPRQERDEDDDNPAIFYGLIASANQLMKDAEVRDKFAAQKDVLCFEMEAAGLMNHFLCLVVRGICDYSDSHKNNRWQGYAAMAAAAYSKALLNQVPPQKVELERRLVDVVEDQLRRIAEQVSRVDHSITYDAIKRLAASNGAMYDSVENRHKPMCLENTRVDLLQDIMQWARKVNDQRIYWLNGMAGTGKSTISRTIASRCNARGILGASFFFSRGESGRNDASLFFGTIAVQLAKVRTNLQPHIIASINETDNITSKGIHEQFRMLVLRPLQQTSTVSRDSTHMIVIDALDECADEKDAEVIVSLLSDIAKEKSFGLKVFITSRPEIATSYAFDPVLGHVQEIILQEVTKHVIDSDIGTFLDHELSKIRNRWNLRHHNNSSARIPEDWPGKETLDILVKHATPLFIFAATVCRFVDDYRFGSPREQLAYMMRTISKGRMTSNMDATYLPVLFKLKDNENAPNLKDHNLVSSFQHVIGTIILLEEPLSIESIAYLTNSKAAEVHRMTYLLKSVLEMSEEPGSPIKLFHLSFRDFLISPSAGEFKIDIKYRHDQMAFSCINLLSTKKHLRYNICGLKPGDARPKLGSQSVQKELPPPVKYACSHLIDHLEQADIILKDGDAFHLFVEVHFLHWIEALIPLGEASKVVSIPERLLRLVKGLEGPLRRFLEDAKFFIDHNISTFIEHVLQLYWSALPFSPGESVIRKTLASCVPSDIRFTIFPTLHWSHRIRILKSERFISTVAISLDSRLLACSQAEGDILLWSMSTGELLREIPRPQQQDAAVSFESLVFAAGSTRLISGSSRTFHIYNTNSGKLTQSITHSLTGTTDVRIDACRHSDIFASIYPDATVGIWSSTTGKLSRWLRDPEFDPSNYPQEDVSEPAYVGFSTDSQAVCGYSHVTKTTLIWNVATGQCLRRLPNFTNDDFAIAFSSSSMLPTIGTTEGNARIIDVITGETMCILSVGPGRPHVAISPDGNFAASRSSSEKLTIWTLPDCHEYRTLQLPSGSSGMDNDYIPSSEVLFSDDGRYLILADMEHIVVWSTSMLDRDRIDERSVLPPKHSSHGINVTNILAANSKVVITNSDHTHKLDVWSMTNGQLLRSLQGQRGGDMNLSPDGKYLFDSGGSNGHLMWDTGNGHSYMIQGHQSPLLNFEKSPTATFSADSRFIVVSSPGGVTLQDLHSGMILLHDNCGRSPVAISPDRRTTMYCRPRVNPRPETLVIRYSVSENASDAFHRVTGKVQAICVCPNSSYTLIESQEPSAGTHHICRMKLINNGTRNGLSLIRTRGPSATAFSHDSSLLAQGCWPEFAQSEQINIWSAATGQMIYTLTPPGLVCSASFAFSPQTLFRVSTKGTESICEVSDLVMVNNGLANGEFIPSHEWHGYSFDEGGKWIRRNGDKVIFLPQERSFYSLSEVEHSIRVQGNVVAWYNKAHEFFMIGISPASEAQKG